MKNDANGLGALSEIRETKLIKEALSLAKVVMESATSRLGEIVGPAGCGKSTAGREVARRLQGARVCAHEGMSRHQLARAIALACGMQGTSVVDRLLAGEAEGRLLVIDEANKLNWRCLELVRYLADECGFAVVLIGTELYERQFSGSRTRELLLQLGSRIGAKRIRGAHLDRAETYVHVVRPWLGDVADKEILTRFWQGCRKGNHREAVELAQECRRVVHANGFAGLTLAAVEAATKWMANRHHAGGVAAQQEA